MHDVRVVLSSLLCHHQLKPKHAWCAHVEPASVASALDDKESVESHLPFNNLESPRRGLKF